jgi:predicted lipid-binding transport protein (Tim44 family)
MANAQLLEIILIAAGAGVILFRLYTVLGRRTGHERPPEDYRRVPGQPPEAVAAAERPGRTMPAQIAQRPADPLQSGLFDISLADKSFDKDLFLTGARAAYEMVENAFAAGDRTALRPLLSDEVYAAFDGALREREALGHKVSFTFVSFTEVKILSAVLRRQTAEIEVSFAAQFISATLDAAGTVVQGDDKSVHDVTDIWTFAHDVQARNPNWTLIATRGEAQ